MTIDLTSHLKTCRRSHPHEEMDDVCERYTEYERELASLRAELQHQKYAYDKEFERAERAEAERDAALKDAERASWLIDTANKEDIEATLLSRRQPHEIRALIDAARKAEQ